MRPLMIISVLMTVVYLCLAVYVFFNAHLFKNTMGTELSRVFSGVLLIYGLFRAWKTYDTYFKNQ
jgi:hypothetical protein